MKSENNQLGLWVSLFETAGKDNAIAKSSVAVTWSSSESMMQYCFVGTSGFPDHEVSGSRFSNI